MAFYSVRQYLECIQRLQTPYPEEGLTLFFQSFAQKFTRKTDLDHIMFNGQHVLIKKTAKILTNEEVEELVAGLLWGHEDTPLAQKVRHLFRNFLPKSAIQRPLPSPSWAEGPYRVVHLRDPPSDPREVWEIGVVSSASPEQARALVEAFSGDSRVFQLKFLERSPSGKKCNNAELYFHAPTITDFQAMWKEVHDRIPSSIKRPVRCEAESLPKYMANLPNLPDSEEETCLLVFAQGGDAGHHEREQLEALSPNALSRVYDGVNYYKYYGTLNVNVNERRYRDLAQDLRLEEQMRGVFTSLLYTHNTNLEVAMKFFSGETQHL